MKLKYPTFADSNFRQHKQHDPRNHFSTLSNADVLEWISVRNLDLCLLAVCSCVLSLMCHQPMGTHTAQLSPGISPTSTPIQIDFLLKAGLVTSSKDDHDIVHDE